MIFLIYISKPHKPVFVSSKISDVFFWWLVAIGVLKTNASHCCMTSLCSRHGKFDVTVFCQLFRHLVKTSKCHTANHIVCGVCPCKCNNIYKTGLPRKLYVPWPSFGSLGHLQTIALC